jgi:hypothetical protein
VTRTRSSNSAFCSAGRYLEKQRVVSLGHHQGNPTSPTDAANANYLNGDIYDSIPIEQCPPAVGKRFSVGVKKLVECFLDLGGTGCFWMKDQRRLVSNADLSTYGTRELGEIQFRATSGRGLFDPIPGVFLQGPGQRFNEVRGASFLVPNSKWVHAGEFTHVLAVSTRTADSTITALAVG